MHHSTGKEENDFLKILLEGGFHKGVEHSTMLTPLEDRFLAGSVDILLTDLQIQMTEIWILNLIITSNRTSTNINALTVHTMKFKGASVYRIAGSVSKIMSIPKNSL